MHVDGHVAVSFIKVYAGSSPLVLESITLAILDRLTFRTLIPGLNYSFNAENNGDIPVLTFWARTGPRPRPQSGIDLSLPETPSRHPTTPSHPCTYRPLEPSVRVCTFFVAGAACGTVDGDGYLGT